MENTISNSRESELKYLRFIKDLTNEFKVDKITTPILENEIKEGKATLDSLCKEVNHSIELKRFTIPKNIEQAEDVFIVPEGYTRELRYLEKNFNEGKEAYNWLNSVNNKNSVILNTIRLSEDPNREIELFLEMWKSDYHIEDSKSGQPIYLSTNELRELIPLWENYEEEFIIDERTPFLYKRVTKDGEFINSAMSEIIAALDNHDLVYNSEESYGFAKFTKGDKEYYLQKKDDSLFLSETITDKRKSPLEVIFPYSELVDMGVASYIDFFPTEIEGSLVISEPQMKEINLLYSLVKDPNEALFAAYSSKESAWYTDFRVDFHSTVYRFVTFFNRVKHVEEM